jgi:hypothetical protein
MLIQYTDFNGSDSLITNNFQNQWNELYSVISKMPLHLKASDQKGKQGSPIFDPVGTNEHLKDELKKINWQPNVRIPEEFTFLGKDVDFTKDGVLVEVQFSNYPFLLNNVVRSELFYKSKTLLPDAPIKVLFIITKAHMFPSSNSTLYYEQAIQQLNSLAKNNVFDVPTRLIGLFEKTQQTSVTWSEYSESRYSRAVANRTITQCHIVPGRTICKLTIIPNN